MYWVLDDIKELFLIFNVYLFEREKEREGGAEREGDRIQSRFQALGCQHRADTGLKPMNHEIMT